MKWTVTKHRELSYRHRFRITAFVEWTVLAAVIVVILAGLGRCQTICIQPASPKNVLDPSASPTATNWLRTAFQKEGYNVVMSCKQPHEFSAWLFQADDHYASYGTGYLIQNVPTSLGNVGSVYTWNLGYLLPGGWTLYLKDSAGNDLLEQRGFGFRNVYKAAKKIEKYKAKRWAEYRKQNR